MMTRMRTDKTAMHLLASACHITKRMRTEQTVMYLLNMGIYEKHTATFTFRLSSERLQTLSRGIAPQLGGPGP